MSPKHPHHIFGSDFDQTIANTHEASPNGVGVHEATQRALNDLFGEPIGTQLVHGTAELHRLAPHEIVHRAIDVSAGCDRIEAARDFIEAQNGSLDGFVHKGRGGSLVWQDSDPSQAIVEAFVRVKLRYLMDEVGTTFSDGQVWPRPMPGFLAFWLRYQAHIGRDFGWFQFGIISSGHDLFIEKCFRVWKLTPPTLLVTDDLMRSPEYRHLTPEERMKPSAVLWRAFHEERDKLNAAKSAHTLLQGPHFPLFAGDSMVADGGLALNSHMPFLWFNPGRHPKSGYHGQLFEFADWLTLMSLWQEESVVHAHRRSSFENILGDLLPK